MRSPQENMTELISALSKISRRVEGKGEPFNVTHIIDFNCKCQFVTLAVWSMREVRSRYSN
jgi:hypothetical protein